LKKPLNKKTKFTILLFLQQGIVPQSKRRVIYKI
jgi:hypothetical protein